MNLYYKIYNINYSLLNIADYSIFFLIILTYVYSLASLSFKTFLVNLLSGISSLLIVIICLIYSYNPLYLLSLV